MGEKYGKQGGKQAAQHEEGGTHGPRQEGVRGSGPEAHGTKVREGTRGQTGEARR
jgi:hypothetical protein